MLKAFTQPLESAIEELHGEAERRRQTTPSDVAAEAFDFAARRFALALEEAGRATEHLTPAEYGALHGGLTAQTITRWIRRGELHAEHTPNGYRIARDAVRTARIEPVALGRTG